MKDQRCKYARHCVIDQECPTCHLFKSKKGSTISVRPDKTSKKKVDEATKNNSKDFLNWNETALYC